MKTLISILLTCSTSLLYAQGFQVNLQGQKQQGMGGAAAALAEDGASLFYNPGAASFLKGNSISTSVSPVISKASFTDAQSNTISKTNSPVSYPFTGYLVFGKKESRLKYGMAVYTPFGSTINWQDNWTGRFVMTHLQLQTIYFQPTVSYKLSDKIGIGAGFVYGNSKINLKSYLPIADEDGNYNSSLQLEGKGHGYGFNAGFYYQPIDKLSFGLTYRSRVNMKMSKGNAVFTVPASMSANFPSGNFSTTLPLPEVVTLATAYKPSKKLTLALDLTMVGWKSYDTLVYDFEKNTPAVSDARLSRNYKNTYSYRMGGQYAASAQIDIRFGLKYLSTPVRNGTVTPEIPDANHLSYSTGLGYKINSSLTADVSFTYEHIKRADANNAIQLNGRYDTKLFIPGFGITYKF